MFRNSRILMLNVLCAALMCVPAVASAEAPQVLSQNGLEQAIHELIQAISDFSQSLQPAAAGEVLGVSAGMQVGFNDLLILGNAVARGYWANNLPDNTTNLPLSMTTGYLPTLKANGVTMHREIISVQAMALQSNYQAMGDVVAEFSKNNIGLIIALGNPVPGVAGNDNGVCIMPSTPDDDPAGDAEWNARTALMGQVMANFFAYLKTRSDVNMSLIIAEPYNEFDGSPKRRIENGNPVACDVYHPGGDPGIGGHGTPKRAATLYKAIVNAFAAKGITNEVTMPSTVYVYYPDATLQSPTGSWVGDYYYYGGGGRPNFHAYPGGADANAIVQQLTDVFVREAGQAPAQYRGRAIFGEIGLYGLPVETSVSAYQKALTSATLAQTGNTMLFWRLTPDYPSESTNWWSGRNAAFITNNSYLTPNLAFSNVGKAIISELSLQQPSNQTATCSADGKNVTLAWNPVTAAVNYPVRIDDTSNNSASCLDGWYCTDGKDYLNDGITGTSVTVPVTPGKTYKWWMHAQTGSVWSGSTNHTFSCTAPTGAVVVKRVGADSLTASAPVTSASIDAGASQTANPLTISSVTADNHTVSFSNIADFSEMVGTCWYPTGGSECSVLTFGTTPTCAGSTCSVPVTVVAGQTLKVAVMYTAIRTCTPESPSTQNQTIACPSGQTGTQTQTRTSSCAAGATAPSWSAWTTSSSNCTAIVINTCTPETPSTQNQTLSCPSGQVGSITQQRTSSCAVGATAPSWSAWTTTSNTCATPVATCTPESPSTQNQTLSCPSGQVGSITQQRTSSCAAGASAPSWSAWTTTSNTCVASAGALSCPTSVRVGDTLSIGVNSGSSYGDWLGVFSQAMYSYVAGNIVPLPRPTTMSFPVAWTPGSYQVQWWPSGASQASAFCNINVGPALVQTSTCTPESPSTQNQTLSCPSGQVGSITQQRTSSCAVGATAPSWSAWTTTSNTCATVVPQNPTCTITANTAAVPYGGGNVTFTISAANATYGYLNGSYLPNPSGTQSGYVYTSGNQNLLVYNNNGASGSCSASVTVCASGQTVQNGACVTPVATCTPESPSTQNQTLSCPSGQVGSITQQRTSSCAVGATAPSWSAWTTTNSNCTVVQTVSAPTCSLSLSPASIVSGSAATITWSTANAANYTLTDNTGAVIPIYAANGQQTVYPSGPAGWYVQYTMNVTNTSGVAGSCVTSTTLTGTTNTQTTQTNPSASSVITASAYTNAMAYRGQNNQRYTFACPAGFQISSVWGTDIYTDDSPICSAGVHAGVITAAVGGQVTIEIRPGQTSYTSTNRNGFTSSSWGGWAGSYAVIKTTSITTPLQRLLVALDILATQLDVAAASAGAR